MKLREYAGAVNRAKSVFLWCPYAPGFGDWVETTKVAAKNLADTAKAEGATEIEARVEEGDLYIGEELTSEPADEPEEEEEEEEEEDDEP